jgi:hypothetical protein
MEHPGRNLTDPAFGRVTDFYSVGCRFESCWDRQQFQLDRCFGGSFFVLRAVTKKTL